MPTRSDRPNDSAVLELFAGAAENLRRGASLFHSELLRDDPGRWAELQRHMKELERDGDEFTHRIRDLVHARGEPASVRLLEPALAVDDAIDGLDGICTRLVLFRIGAVRPRFLELAGLAEAAARQLLGLVESLRLGAGAAEAVRRIRTLENRADSLFRDDLGDLFVHPEDPVLLIKWKEILERLERVIDRIDDSARLLGNLATGRS